MLLCLLVLGPLVFACTRATPLNELGWGLHVVFATWILGLLVERRKPGIPGAALIAGCVLVVYAWLRLWLFPPAAISEFTSAHFSRIYDRWPESIILRTPAAITLLTSGLLVGFLVATDLACRPFWKRGLLFTMVAVSCIVVVIGLIQNVTHASGIYWQKPKNHMPSPFFGPFYHFTSAGAFLNLTWPIAASMAMYSFKCYISESKPLLLVLIWSSLLTLLFLGHTGHVSRFPQVIALATLVGLIAVQRPFANLKWSWRSIAIFGLATMISGFAVLWVIARTGRVHDIAARWQMLNVWGTGEENALPPPLAQWPELMRDDLVVPYEHSHFFLRDRGAAYAFAAQTAMRRPIFGFGPGGWMAAVSQYANDPTIGTFYLYLQFTHEDFLQAWIEWGLAGCVCWIILFCGGIYASYSRLTRNVLESSREAHSRALILGALAAVFAVLVQSLIDFPLQIPANALYASILLAVCWSSVSRDPLSASSTKNVHEQ